MRNTLLSFPEDKARLVAAEASQNWPAQQPVLPRQQQFFLRWILPVLLFAAVLFAVQLAVCPLLLGILNVLLFFLVLVLGFPVTTFLLWLETWNWPADLYLKMLFLGLQAKLQGSKDTRAGDLTMPVTGLKPKQGLEKTGIDYALAIEVPKASEDEFVGASAVQQAVSEKAVLLSRPTDPLDSFAPNEDPVQWVMDRLGTVYPPLTQVWDDKQSDAALTRMCLYGLGAHRIDVEEVSGERLFVVRCNVLSRLTVRKGFARYGGDAYFDARGQPVKIVDEGLGQARLDGSVEPVTIRPGDPRWAEAKFRFRSSLSVLVTLVDHLYGCHLQVSNILVTSLRECMSPHHPLRRFLVPFCYGTITVNDNARTNLVHMKTLAPRVFGFTDQSLRMAFGAAPTLLRLGFEVPAEDGGIKIDFEKYVEYLREKGIDTDFFRKGVAYWRVVKTFVVKYVESYFTHAGFVKDPEVSDFLQNYLHKLKNIRPSSLGASSQSPWESLLNSTPRNTSSQCWGTSAQEEIEQVFCLFVNLLTHFMFTVTAVHEHVGAVEVYVQDASFCAFKWVPGALSGTKQTALAQALLMSFTATPMPKLLGGDWTHLFPPVPEAPQVRAKAVETFRQFQRELAALARQCDADNAASSSRPFPNCFPLYCFNPRWLETSISV